MICEWLKRCILLVCYNLLHDHISALSFHTCIWTNKEVECNTLRRNVLLFHPTAIIQHICRACYLTMSYPIHGQWTTWRRRVSGRTKRTETTIHPLSWCIVSLSLDTAIHANNKNLQLQGRYIGCSLCFYKLFLYSLHKKEASLSLSLYAQMPPTWNGPELIVGAETVIFFSCPVEPGAAALNKGYSWPTGTRGWRNKRSCKQWDH